jgi:peptidoglycan/LPS O-acetylase OafA/YrhL
VNGKRADIQGLRAIAVLMVVLYHASGWPSGGFTGVDIFFVVSGFVITASLLRELSATGRISIQRFYVRRVRRLLPALALVSVVTSILAVLVLSPIGGQQEATGMGVASASVFVANLYFLRTIGDYFGRLAPASPFLHTWTLSIEEQFYLVFPWLLVLSWLIARGSARRLVGCLLVCLLFSFAACVTFTYNWLPNLPGRAGESLHRRATDLAFYLPVTRAWEFLVGSLVAVAARRWVPPDGGRWMAAAAGLALVVAAGVATNRPFPGLLAAIPVAGAACLIVAGLGPHPPIVTRLLSGRAMVWVGDRSYGWYLWHWPALVLARAVFPDVWIVAAGAAVVALAAADLSYRLVEQPIRLGRRFASPRATIGMASACLAIPLACGAGLVAAADRSWGRPDVAALRAVILPDHTDALSGCASTAPLGSPNRPACVWPATATASRGTILLIGDSHAGHLTEPLIAAANGLGYDAQVATIGGCPMIVPPVDSVPFCGRFVTESLAAIAHHRPAYAAVVISNASANYINRHPELTFAADADPPETQSIAPDRRARIRGWVARARRAVDAIGRSSPVVVIGAVPRFPGLPGCLRPSLFSGPAAGCGYLNPGTAGALLSDVITEERATVRTLGATYLDAADRLCTAGRGCSAFVDGALVFRDSAHLSVRGSMLFESDLRNALASTIRLTSSGGRAMVTRTIRE